MIGGAKEQAANYFLLGLWILRRLNGSPVRR